MNNRNNHFDQQPKERHRINDYIRCPTVLLIKDDQKIGVIPTDEAKRRAREEGLDLVEVSPQARPPVCKIMDYSKFKYELAVKEKEAKKKQRIVESKQIRLTPKIAANDLSIKINSAKKFLSEGYFVNFTLKFKNREKAHKDIGVQVMKRVIEELSDVAIVKTHPRLDGDFVNCILEPKK